MLSAMSWLWLIVPGPFERASEFSARPVHVYLCRTKRTLADANTLVCPVTISPAVLYTDIPFVYYQCSTVLVTKSDVK
jgi:hypothetical protein